MKPEEIQITDYARILLGQLPPSFLLEAVLRIVFFFTLLIVSMRLMGKRMAGQLGRSEVAAMTSLAASIGVPILTPDRGLLPAVVVAAVVVSIERGVAWWSSRNRRFEQTSQGKLAIMVQDGCLELAALEQATLSREQVVARLRGQGLHQLGQVKRLYMEANGTFTLIKQQPPHPGLTLAPDWDEAYIQRQPAVADTYACTWCGQVQQAPALPQTPCPRCSRTAWRIAVC